MPSSGWLFPLVFFAGSAAGAALVHPLVRRTLRELEQRSIRRAELEQREALVVQRDRELRAAEYLVAVRRSRPDDQPEANRW